jgi:hypothetical protein
MAGYKVIRKVDGTYMYIPQTPITRLLRAAEKLAKHRVEEGLMVLPAEYGSSPTYNRVSVTTGVAIMNNTRVNIAGVAVFTVAPVACAMGCVGLNARNVIYVPSGQTVPTYFAVGTTTQPSLAKGALPLAFISMLSSACVPTDSTVMSIGMIDNDAKPKLFEPVKIIPYGS